MTNDNNHIHLGRRAFLKHGTLVLAAASLNSRTMFASDEAPRLRVGLITDLHYADKGPAGTRYYRETLAKLVFEDGNSVAMKPGDHVLIPAHKRHRVEWTTPDEPTIWLAVFHKD